MEEHGMRMAKVAVLVVMLLGIGAMNAWAAGDITKHYEDSIFKVTDDGLFGIEMRVHGDNLKMGVNMVDLIIHDKADKDVPGAEIKVTPWMPDMGHGVSEKPRVKERGGGLYTVENIILIMTGRWELRINVRKGDTEDKVVFDFPDVGAAGHAHPEAPVPSDIDTSTSVHSENRLFKASYESDRTPVPINRIHSWRLKIESSEGKPVEGARITIVGDMPEHGHGFPTKPEVTEETEKGVYLIEGIKFSMPGWWVVIFHIEANYKQDSASFNLFLR
jgi:hypothetical protein